jgi:type I restriction enzyme S subunit
MPRADWGFIGSLLLCFPPISEQSSIVRYLDHIDRRIRRYIRTKQKLIKLLEEQKQAIIHQAVTRGLDPDVKLKLSGVEWLGEVPEHWEVRKLKFEIAFTGGGTPSKANADFWNGNIPWVSPKDMKVSVINDTADHISASAVTESSTKLIDPGAVLVVVRSGILRRKIPVAINNVSVALNQDMKALESKGRLHNDYIFALIEGCQKILLTEWTKQGATVESIEYELIANSFIPIPPKDEQLAIVHFLTEANKNTDSAIAKARREISLLREYRTRLIADVVTGKLDVREAAANLPEELNETEVLDEELTGDEENTEENLESEPEE